MHGDYGNRHDDVLFLKLALLLLVILGVGLLATGVTIGTSEITVAPVAQGDGQAVCGSPFSPAKEGATQPGGQMLTRIGEWRCEDKMGILGQMATVMVSLGICSLLAAGAVGIALAVTVSRQLDRPGVLAMQLRPFQGGSLRVVDVKGRQYVLKDDLVAISPAKQINLANHLNAGDWRVLRYSASPGSQPTKAVFIDIAALPKLSCFFYPDQHSALTQALNASPAGVGDTPVPG